VALFALSLDSRLAEADRRNKIDDSSLVLAGSATKGALMGRFSILGAFLLFCATSAMAQGIEGVHSAVPPGQLQFGVGVTFVSFSEAPGTTENNVGVNASVVDYRDWMGVEGQVSDAFGSQSGQMTQVLFTGGGVRFRWTKPRAFQPWVHAVLGYSHLSPLPTFGGGSALGYKVGAGLDIKPHHGRIGFRVGADFFGTRFFHTYQDSPEISAGIVFSLGHN
jgi:hypothetical protein